MRSVFAAADVLVQDEGALGCSCTESMILCLLGGIGGILLGLAATEMIATYAGWPALFSTEAMIAAVSVSAAVGLFFGFYPAWKASRLDPISALGRE